MSFPALPPEGTYTDLEHEWIDSEPPGLFPIGQDSYWGQLRKLLTDQLQTVANLLATYWLDLDPSTVDETDIHNYEIELGVPVDAGSRTLTERQAFVSNRLVKGPFTRTRRRRIVEAFIVATFNPPITFAADGVPFVAGGIPFGDETVDVSTSYEIVENIPGFSYDVRILNTIDIDFDGLTRELDHITSAPLTFTITPVASL